MNNNVQKVEYEIDIFDQGYGDYGWRINRLIKTSGCVIRDCVKDWGGYYNSKVEARDAALEELEKIRNSVL